MKYYFAELRKPGDHHGFARVMRHEFGAVFIELDFVSSPSMAERLARSMNIAGEAA